MEKKRIRDGKEIGSWINIPDPQHWFLPGYPSGSLGRRSLSGLLLRKGPRPGGRTSVSWDADRGRDTLPTRPFLLTLNKYVENWAFELPVATGTAYRGLITGWIGPMHRLNMELDLPSLFGLHATWCAQLYSLAETPHLHPPPAFGLMYEGRYWSANIDDISL